MKSQDEVREKIFKTIGLFLKSEQILAGNPGYSNKEMKKRLDWLIEKITEMKKNLK